MVRLDNFSLASIIPDSIIRDKNIQAIIQADFICEDCSNHFKELQK